MNSNLYVEYVSEKNCTVYYLLKNNKKKFWYKFRYIPNNLQISIIHARDKQIIFYINDNNQKHSNQYYFSFYDGKFEKSGSSKKGNQNPHLLNQKQMKDIYKLFEDDKLLEIQEYLDKIKETK